MKTEEQRREEFNRRIATINADERLAPSPALRQWVIDQETEIFHRDIAAIRAQPETEE
jgi:hypothetical protein